MAKNRNNTRILNSAITVEQQACGMMSANKLTYMTDEEIRARLSLIRQSADMIEAELEKK